MVAAHEKQRRRIRQASQPERYESQDKSNERFRQYPQPYTHRKVTKKKE